MYMYSYRYSIAQKEAVGGGWVERADWLSDKEQRI